MEQVALSFGQRDRSYLIHHPPQASAASRVMLALHGAGTCAAEMVDFCGLNPHADQHDCVLIYPNGTGRSPTALTWNGGRNANYAGRRNIDDVGFVQHLLDDVSQRYGYATQQIFLTGMSNGALMSYRLAEELPDRCLAIAPVAGVMASLEERPLPPVPVVHFHGTDDTFVPFEGGVGPDAFSRDAFMPVLPTVAAWARANACDFPPSKTPLPQTARDGTSVDRWEYQANGQPRVLLYQIHGAGHTWPGQPSPLPRLGVSTANLSASACIFDFFQTVVTELT